MVPPKGVPVRSFGETGCGGSNFTFCGYHDSFLSGGRRFRYAVLPFPCSQDRGTCFVDAAEDPGRALQAVGSHELAETITDPDRPPVGPSGWFGICSPCPVWPTAVMFCRLAGDAGAAGISLGPGPGAA